MKIRLMSIVALLALLPPLAEAQALVNYSDPATNSPYAPRRSPSYTSFDNPYAPGALYDPYRGSRRGAVPADIDIARPKSGSSGGKSGLNGSSGKDSKGGEDSALADAKESGKSLRGSCGGNSLLAMSGSSPLGMSGLGSPGMGGASSMGMGGASSLGMSGAGSVGMGGSSSRRMGGAGSMGGSGLGSRSALSSCNPTVLSTGTGFGAGSALGVTGSGTSTSHSRRSRQQ